MRAAIDALAARFRVVSYSLAGERGSTRRMDASTGFDDLVVQLADVVRTRNLQHPLVCGVSYGGLVALRYAASHAEAAGLVLVSTPSPLWRPNPRLARYRRAPRLFAPLFAAQALGRLLNELAITFPSPRTRMRFLRSHLTIIAGRPLSPTRASRRLELLARVDFAADCRTLRAPVLIVTGEPELDHVVPVDDTLTYRSLIPHAVVRTIDRTGHLGSLTRADVFSAIVGEFAGGRAEHSR
jgi:pimeloyl-ACP methyl ester carboxylesterase